MKLLVGLGNPGAKYARNRHNVGYMAVDAMARTHGFGPWRKRFQAEVAEGRIGEEPCLLIKPTTFMNESGRSVSEATRFYKLPPYDVFVFHDELDLPPGKMRVKGGGSHAGHNGLRSIDAHIGPQFYRVRIGVGHPGAREQVTRYVLHDFAKIDAEWLDPLLQAIADAAPELVQENDGRFMNQVSLAMQHLKKDEAKGKAPAKTKADAKAQNKTQERPPVTSATSEGPLAGMLRRWLGGGKN